MQTKNVIYAAVGAPVVAARKVSDQVSTLRSRVSDEATSYTEVANKAIDGWATEGENFVSELRDGKVVEEISQKVDFDQAREQVGKLRDQLEEMLATWRQSFRPEEAGEQDTGGTTAETPAAEKPANKSTAATKPAAKSSAAKTTQSSSAAKKSSEESTASEADPSS